MRVARIIVIGSAARDEVVRLAEPLRAGAHLNGTTAGFRLGGGGANTAVALAVVGHQVTLLAAVGRDPIGDALLTELKAAGVDISQVARLSCSTTQSLILLDPAGERTVVNVARCEEEAPPRRLLDLPADAVYVRSRRTDLAPLLASKVEPCLVVAHMPPVDAASRQRTCSSRPPRTSTRTQPTIRWPWDAGSPGKLCAGSSSQQALPAPGRYPGARC